MLNKKTIISISSLLFMILGCQSKEKATIENVKQSNSSSELNPHFNLRSYQIVTLANGATIVYVPDNTLPRVHFSMVLKSGSMVDEVGKDGISYLTSNLLSQGSRSKNAQELSKVFNELGTEFTASVSSDISQFYVSTLSSEAKKLWLEFFDVLKNPIFSNDEIIRLKSQMTSLLEKKKENPASFAESEYEKILYKDSPYGRELLGSEATIGNLKREDCLTHYKSWFQPQNMIFTVSGQFSEELKSQIESQILSWKKTHESPTSWQGSLPQPNFEKTLITKNHLVQSQIRIGQRAIERLHPDFLPLRLASEALGGGFGARLMQKIRDDLGLTYSVGSRTDGRKKIGAFTIFTFSRTDKTKQTIDEVLKIYELFVKKGISEEELATAKSQILNQFPRTIETPEAMAVQIAILKAVGYPDDFIKTYQAKINSITLKEVNAAIAKHLSKDKLKVFVYGNDSLNGTL